MKTFSEFILEAKVNWNSGPKSKAYQKLKTLERDVRTKPSPELIRRIKQLKSKIKFENELNPTGPTKESTARKNTGRPQKPEIRDPRRGPTAAQRSAEGQANKILGSSVESGSTVIRRNADGSTTRVPANYTKEPVNIRSDATRKERRSGASRPTARPEVGRYTPDGKSAENAPKSFRNR